ncbi:hypothetical protein [Virgibacillus pantothenticus]|nr:hypothetical protein [Virgibacillus pantothenticus]MED3735224.1 hypothetical protein [Virgibacillus pantothenticus]
MNLAFYVATGISFVGLILAFFVKDQSSKDIKEKLVEQQEA